MSIRNLALPYASPQNGVAVFHLCVTVLMYFGAIVVGTMYFDNLIILALSVTVFAGGAIRFFGIQHDNGHLSYFTSRKWNEISGVLLGAFTGNPYYAMRYNHNRHHAYIGNLDERDAHEVLTWTVAEYQAATPREQLFYRIYRSLPVMYFIGPLFIIFVRYRIPKNFRKTGWSDVIMQNVLMFGFWGVLFYITPYAFAFLMLGSVATSCFGVFMVYAGHNYEDAYWESRDNVDFEEASLKGASVLDFGRIFHFCSFNFAFHDLHHLQSKIPCYRLQACHIALQDALQPTRMGLVEALACIKWKLWDEDTGKMVRFCDVPQPVVMRPAE